MFLFELIDEMYRLDSPHTSNCLFEKIKKTKEID